MTALDPGHAEADKLLQKLIREIQREYRTAGKELKEKFAAYMESFEKKDAAMRAKMEAGDITEKDYKDWRVGQILTGQRWKQMEKVITEDLLNADKIAVSIINGYTPEAYAINHNYGTYEAETGAVLDTSYTLYDRETVERLFRDPDLLPDYVDHDIFVDLNVPKAERWDKKKINSAILQGVLQGEGIPKIAARLVAVAGMGANSAIRNARTAMTGAENAGRIDSYKRAESKGIRMVQVWTATLDGRTRDSHRHLDGEKREVGQKFSNGCRYPGDPQGRPEEIYNCRCSVFAEVEGSDVYDASDVSKRANKLEGMSYEEWKREHMRKAGK